MKPIEINAESRRSGDRERALRVSTYRSLRAAALALILIITWVLVYRQLLPFARFFSYDLLHLARTSRLGQAIEFFAYDTPKVLMLL